MLLTIRAPSQITQSVNGPFGWLDKYISDFHMNIAVMAIVVIIFTYTSLIIIMIIIDIVLAELAGYLGRD